MHERAQEEVEHVSQSTLMGRGQTSGVCGRSSHSGVDGASCAMRVLRQKCKHLLHLVAMEGSAAQSTRAVRVQQLNGVRGCTSASK